MPCRLGSITDVAESAITVVDVIQLLSIAASAFLTEIGRIHIVPMLLK